MQKEESVKTEQILKQYYNHYGGFWIIGVR